MINEIKISPAINKLYNNYIANSEKANAEHGGKIYYADNEWVAFCDARLQAYQETIGYPPIIRRARMMELFAQNAIVSCSVDDLLAGSQKFCAFKFTPEVNDELCKSGYAHNAGHIVYNYESLLIHGINELNEKLLNRKKIAVKEEELQNIDAFIRALQAFKQFINRHTLAVLEMAHSIDDAAEQNIALKKALSLRRLGQGLKPASFHDALQMVWFTQIFLHAENPAAAISFGRIDQCLWPFLDNDLKSGIIDIQDAANLIAAFYLRCCEGEESQNMTLGGVNSNGDDATNPLSVLMLRVMRELKVTQPSISVRIHDKTPQDFINEACKLAAKGTGQPGFINDSPVIAGLKAAGIPEHRANDYAIVGCYEATTQGDCYPNTVGNCYTGSIPTLPKLLNEYMVTDTARQCKNFNDFINGWYLFINEHYQYAVTNNYQKVWDSWSDMAPSPFSSILIDGCIDRALPVESGGADYNLFGVNILGLGTVIDSLHVIRELVFDKNEMTISEISNQIDNDFPDENIRRKLLSLPGRYGSDCDKTNQLAKEVSEKIARMVLDSRIKKGVRPYPAFFRFTADIHDHPYATPDGRRKDDNLSYGCGPSSGCGGSPTSILASAANVAHNLCACGNPLALSLQSDNITGDDGIEMLNSLIKGYFNSGGFHLHFNLQSAETLRAAKTDPVNHTDVTIRISGLSARFVTLNEQLQDALIERADKGI